MSMEINRLAPAGVTLSVDSAAAQKPAEQAATLLPVPQAAPAPTKAGEPRLEALQNAMRELPDVGFDKVLAIRQALAKGEIDIDSQALAKLMMTHHRGAERE